ncbi:Nucleoside-diphosphate-sugar epimerase [Malonomonas rubra DSM 5091]|uniref:Nucleoside-diphosphate-sugar epimerase n=1 Tax=Malonomonas rubra DSM 5091 TaxID=1122189 RepID=A0A1M6BP83_MALRU|nr:SDR family oxidoreductase [Malonomonas rubra]SHI50502.1 Nucleoside-diphosphate-sugar epimerase [Malonomonas rubra DSM 5091]
MQHYLIVGCGDIGNRVGKILLEQGAQVTATAKTEERASELQEKGFSTVVGNFDYQEDAPKLPCSGKQVFYFMPPQGGGKSDYRMLNFCRQLSPENTPKKLVYISTSGVYGDCGGEVVTEDRPINPQTARAMRRASAENQLMEQAEKLGFELVILRVTGIYGPGRLPVARIVQGHPVLLPEDASFTNRIHAFDLVQVCLAAMERGEHGDIFNVCDGQESSMTDYFLAVADLYALERPKQISMAQAEKVMNPLMLSYQKESRRMSNRKMLDKLNITLQFPTLQDGLKVCREEE